MLKPHNNADHLGLEKHAFRQCALTLSYKTLMIHQQADKSLQQLALINPEYSLTQFHGGGKVRT